MSEKKYFYHGSIQADITKLKASSLLHETNKKVVYLTDNIPYALLYIWSGKHNNYDRKFVTGWIKNKIACYEEIFPNQLEIFYKNVAGYLYCVEKNSDISAVNGRESMYYSETDIVADRTIYISDIYQELMKYETAGKFRLFRFNEQSKESQNKLIDKSADIIIRSNFFETDEAKLNFYKKYFSEAWERANIKYNQK
ncbi:MAG: hypothetical protein K2N26_04600 [Oscillospiraceae bacterium]|nr:hypothetical protein [Oscillospiraceae bacterium]